MNSRKVSLRTVCQPWPRAAAAFADDTVANAALDFVRRHH